MMEESKLISAPVLLAVILFKIPAEEPICAPLVDMSYFRPWSCMDGNSIHLGLEQCLHVS